MDFKWRNVGNGKLQLSVMNLGLYSQNENE